MASTRIRIDIEWENGKDFEITTKENDASALTVVKADENGHLAALWSSYTDTVERYVKAIMARVGAEMKQP